MHTTTLHFVPHPNNIHFQCRHSFHLPIIYPHHFTRILSAHLTSNLPVRPPKFTPIYPPPSKLFSNHSQLSLSLSHRLHLRLELSTNYIYPTTFFSLSPRHPPLPLYIPFYLHNTSNFTPLPPNPIVFPRKYTKFLCKFPFETVHESPFPRRFTTFPPPSPLRRRL